VFKSYLFVAVMSFVGALVVTPGVAYSFNDAGHFCKSSLTKAIPGRTHNAISASRFVARVNKSNGEQREALILDQIMDGNIPGFLRHLYPVTIKKKMHDGTRITITLCVMPDYLAVGSNRDFLRIPMGMKTATTIAQLFDFALPTPKIVDAIHAQTDKHLSPKPMTPGPEMTSTEYYSQHNRLVEQQRRAKNIPLGSLLAGQKKDLVITNRLRDKPGRVAIYGWQHPNGKPIQPLSTVHDAEYADYSHGVRLVSTTAYVNGKKRSLYDLLEDPKLASMISKEGGIPDAARLVAGKQNITANRLSAYQRRAYKSPRG
jgi:hypothetical protein